MPTAPRIYESEFKGPAGTPLFGIETTAVAASGCYLCPDNTKLAFRPRIMPSHLYPAYFMPSSRQVTVQARGESTPKTHLLPLPFAARLIPFEHQRNRLDGSFHLGVPSNWMAKVERLLTLVPGLAPGDSFSLQQQWGGAASGAQPQGYEAHDVHGMLVPHSYTRITYGRDRLRELSERHTPQRLGALLTKNPITTADVGIDRIVHQSRRAAGSIPTDQELWSLWERYAGEQDDLEKYYREALAFVG